MSKRFRIVKRISKEDTGHFEDIEVDDDFVDNEMVQIIADNEYDPLYDDCESIAVALQLAGYGKIADLEAKLAEKDKAIENWQTMYKSVVQTCHNDKEEIERLNKILATQEKTITNLVEDNRASQEWYRKQLEEKDKEIEHQESMKILAVENQNKNAIEQLEKVKSAFGLINSKLDKVETIKEYIHYIDHQINELKGKVE